MNIVVAPQINTQIGLNLAVLSPGAQQTIGQVAGNNLGVGQGGGAAPGGAGAGAGAKPAGNLALHAFGFPL